jgi:hypothetical protein
LIIVGKTPPHLSERQFNPETAPLKQWPFIYTDEDQHWSLDWSELVGFTLGYGIVGFVIFIIALMVYTGLMEIGL